LTQLSDGCLWISGVPLSSKAVRGFRCIRHGKMKQKTTGLSQRYVAALRKHLKEGTRATLQAALALGQRAAAFGLDTSELALIHERALAALEPGDIEQTKRRQSFFTVAVSTIVETHRDARMSGVNLNRLNELLGRCTTEMAATNRQLQRTVIGRKLEEAAFKKSGQHHEKCLAESLRLQKHLQRLAHRVLTTQEDQRTRLSHELQNEIAQTLLGINVRLLSLKQEARSNTKGLKNEIASAQRLVVESARSVRRFARQLEIHPLAP